jgi:hypothetical protein
MINILLFIIIILISLCIAFLIVKNPKLFWPMIIFFSIIGSGLMINAYTFYDEYLIGCVLIGVFLLNIYTSKSRNEKVDKIHYIIFVLFMVYLLYQSIYGAIILYSPRKIRWIVFFTLLLIINNLSIKEKYPKLCPRELSYLITVFGLIYYGFYFIYGFSFGLIGVNWHLLQFAQTGNLMAIWGTTAYTLFPIVISMPCALFLLKDKNAHYRRLGWITIILLIINVLYYKSRVGFISILIFFISSIPIMGVKKWLFISMISIFSFSIIFLLTYEGTSLEFFMSETFGFGDRIMSAKEAKIITQDVDRYIWAIVAFESISDNWWHFLFGHGFRTSGYVVAPLVHDLFLAFGKEITHYSSNVGTEMFTNLVVETGMVGLVLYTLNFIILGKRIISRKSNPKRYVLLSALVISYFWMFVINLIDIVLLYLLIMPNGLLTQLIRYEPQNVETNDPRLLNVTSQ